MKNLIRKLKTNPKFFIENLVHIRTKEGKVLKIKLNKPQLKLLKYVVECLQEDKPIRVIVLKARQEGFSTLIESIIYWWTTTHHNIGSRIIADKEESTNNLFNMTKLMYDLHPIELKPMKRYSNRKELVFENPDEKQRENLETAGLRSRIRISTAGNTDIGRSETNQCIHASEVAFWKDGESIIASMMQTIPMKPKTMIYLESTANGIGGYFYNEWQAAKQGESTFKPFFFSWFDHEEYRLPVPEGFTLNEEEAKIKKLYQLEDEQIAWWREKRKEFVADIRRFYQEYPSNDFEAFLASGRPRFDTNALQELLYLVKEPVRGYLENQKFIEQKEGPLRVWKSPFITSQYIIGIDVAEGLEHGDNSIIEVFDRYTAEQVAEWQGKCDPDELGRIAFNIGRYYNTAFIGVEVNNHGLTTLTILKQLNYPNLYYRRQYDDRTQAQTTKLGWQTNLKTKPLAVDELAVWIREKTGTFNSKELIEECLTYMVDDNGRTNAQEGCKDDRVMASAIALQMFKHVSIAEEQQDPKIKQR